MANAYKVTLVSAVDDGTNIYCEMQVQSASQTFPNIYPVFKDGTTAATIKSYMQVIANNQPTLADDIAALINVPVAGV